MKRLAGLVGALTLLLGSLAHAVTGDQFQVSSTADLVALCSAQSGDPNAEEAVAFCHGFGSGAYHYHLMSMGARKTVCFPEPRPSRSSVLQAFVAWAKGKPEYMDQPAVDTMFRFLDARYPCM